MHEKHPKSSDTMDTRPVTSHFYFYSIFSPRIQFTILKHVGLHEDDMQESDSSVTYFPLKLPSRHALTQPDRTIFIFNQFS